jgi:hypothetical protein
VSITREEFFDYVKRSQSEIMNDTQTYSQPTRHYLKRFDKHGHKRFFLSWNWAGFFFTFMWMAYRKLLDLLRK